MGKEWLLTMKPSFNTQWLGLPLKEGHQIHKKIEFLIQNPQPDGDTKKQLKYKDKNLYRLRSGDYRIFYTYDSRYISLLALRRRQEDTYDENIDAEFLGGFDISYEDAPIQSPPAGSVGSVPILSASATLVEDVRKRLLPETITEDLLRQLQIADEYHTLLLPLKSETELLDAAVPQDITSCILDHFFPPSLSKLQSQPDQIIQHVDDLLRLKQGEFLQFLLRLSPEQERAAAWSKNITGPTQVKGKPGTGKSMVALHRVQSILKQLQQDGIQSPRILFTTYTNSLIQSSRQLLELLLGENVQYIHITTADKLILSFAEKHLSHPIKVASESTPLGLLKNKCNVLKSDKPDLYQSIAHLSPEYILDEISFMITARGIERWEEYEKLDRSGYSRDVRLGSRQRQAVWTLYKIYLQQLATMKQYTWQSLRVEVEKIHAANPLLLQYDAVIVDEAQDLDPSVLRLLFNACKAPNRFFVTADANQSIYGKGFTWREVHEGLRFQGGRTTVLKTNYRSTRQIGEAAQSYLSDVEVAEIDATEWVHMHNGSLPEICRASDEQEEFNALTRFLLRSASTFQAGLSSCAVLCPTKQIGIAIADQLKQANIRAVFMQKQQVNLAFSGVKVMTLH
ncbi:MAG TPA: UvrD-helicase domain-containing protein, partial [Ktedonobacteraceae bacterium]